ncbi:MarR family winged helix-turn-helix transcriptional regulator [Sphingobium lignivorans]|uniref:DNA-binding MarR family transcriptional regulator n=1 Tax=Sphingobium lignivorans TaxID=2735886 RepID=A0ABR6NKY9_9SPHN|nr:winged helix DNA-binding protein [Sphingobium lignivorans]MBB5986829.1 DNA-binding MarR family transcriptional regulator [Sphingobium lignivorans]
MSNPSDPSETPQTLQSNLSEEAEMLHNILKLANRLMAPFSTFLAHEHRISLNEFRVMMQIGFYNTTASHELVELTGVNAMSISRAVATLERHGRVVTVPDPTNRRRKRLTLTAEGERLFRAMRPATDLVAQYLLSRLKPHEKAALDHILRTLIDTLEAKDEEGRSLFLEHTRPDRAVEP